MQRPRSRPRDWVRSALILSALLGASCHEVGNPVTRETPSSPYPSEGAAATSTLVRYARQEAAVAWARAPAPRA